MLTDRQLCSQVCKVVLIPSKLGFPVTVQSGGHLPAMQETQVQFPGREDPLEKEMAAHSSILAWRIPWTEEPSGLQSMGSQGSGMTSRLNHHHHHPSRDDETKWKWKSLTCVWVSDTLWSHGLYSSWNSLGQNTGVGSLSLLQGIFPTQGWNPGLPLCRQIFYQLSNQGSPRILEWVAYPF